MKQLVLRGTIALGLLGAAGCRCTTTSFDQPAYQDSPRADDPPEGGLRLLSWNSWLIGSSSSPSDRVASIADAVEGYDLVALQEVWRPFRAKLLPRLAAMYHVIAPEAYAGTANASSGLLLLSRWPVEEVWSEAYRREIGEDRLAGKGFLWARIRPDGREPFEVVVTHLQADPVLSSQSPREARHQQLLQLQEFLCKRQEADPDTPRLLMGDFNVVGPVKMNGNVEPRPDFPEYWEMIETLELASGLEPYDVFLDHLDFTDHDRLPPEPLRYQGITYEYEHNWNARLGAVFAGEAEQKVRFDYLFYFGAHHRLEVTDVSIRRFRCGDCPLSDHYALEASLLLR